MKLLVICLALFAAAQSAKLPPHHDYFVAMLGNPIDDLVKEAFEYFRQEMKAHDPFPVPPIPEQVINDDDNKIYVTLNLTDVFVSKASDFTVDHIENNLIDFWAKFGVTVPTANVYGNFQIAGTALGKKVEGTGTFSIDVTGLNTTGFIQNELLEDKYLHIKSMTLTYDIQDLQFKEQGLVVEGMTQEELEKFFSTQLLKFLKDHETDVCAKIAEQGTMEINEMMKGKTLQDVIDWLKHLIDPTASPQLA